MATQYTESINLPENVESHHKVVGEDKTPPHQEWTRDSSKQLHAHWDCFSGAAGDMMLAACLDSVSPLERRQALLRHVQSCIENGLSELNGEFSIEMKQVWKGGKGSIAATHVTVHSRYNHKPAPVPAPALEGDTPTSETSKEGTSDDTAVAGNHHDHSHSHGHSHGHEHGHSHQHSSTHDSTTHSHVHNHDNGGPLRNLPQIRQMLLQASTRCISDWVREKAIAAFEALAAAEATTHGASSIESVHFHEVGAIDSIVDTVGTLVALFELGVVSVSCSRLPLGQGTVWTDHGLLPVPAPATARLLQDMPLCPGPMTNEMTGELVTPTAAALLKVLVSPECQNHAKRSAGGPPCFTLRRVGVGAGTKEFVNHPNIIRLFLGDDVIF